MNSSTNGAPDVWAIVLMYGNEADTAACIESLLRQDYKPLTILLVDNNAQDGGGTRLRERFPAVEYLDTSGNLGYAGGMNRGIERALAGGADDLLILNNDTTLERNCVSQLVASRISTADAGLVAPKILCYDEPHPLWYAGGDLSRMRAVGQHRRFGDMDKRDGKQLERVTFASGCAFLMPATAARAMGGFAEDFFMYCEDVELALRLERAGYRLYYQPAARVYHRDSVTDEPAPFAIRLRDRNRRRIARRHYNLPWRAAFAAWFYPTRAVLLGQYLLRGDWARARAIVDGALRD